LLVVGLSYHSAPVELRERLALSDHELADALLRLHEPTGPLQEAVILSTCNRLEVYAVAMQPAEGIAWIEHVLCAGEASKPGDIRSLLTVYTADAVVEHLLRVASGMESMILGESQILGQIARAYEEARRVKVCGPVLSHLFSQAIHAGKRARTETSIGRFSTSVSHSGATLIRDDFGGVPSRVLIVGAGEMAGLAAQALARQGVTELRFVSRTYARALQLAEAHGGFALPWDHLQQGIAWAEAVLCATSAPHSVIHPDDVLAAIAEREGRPLVFVDIAVPRDVDEEVRHLPGIRYYDIDDLQTLLDANLERRRAAIPAVETILEAERARYMEWYHGREVTPVIRDLRDWAQTVAADELEETLSRLADADPRTRHLVERLTHRLVNRLLHEPTARLRMQAAEGYACGYTYAVRELFALWTDRDGQSGADAPSCTWAGHETDESGPCDLRCLLDGSQDMAVSS
jgi:glutamyl-tRNA reductase